MLSSGLLLTNLAVVQRVPDYITEHNISTYAYLGFHDIGYNDSRGSHRRLAQQRLSPSQRIPVGLWAANPTAQRRAEMRGIWQQSHVALAASGRYLIREGPPQCSGFQPLMADV